MGSRIRPRKQIRRLFECFLIIDPPSSSLPSSSPPPSPSIRSLYPSTFSSPDLLRTASQFCFPYPPSSSSSSSPSTVELFTFVLTSESSTWTFGYCRHPPSPSSPTFLFLSFLPWQEIFYRALNLLAELPPSSPSLSPFLHSMYTSTLPEPGTCLYIPSTPKPFICPVPSPHSLPSIPENRNVSEFYNALTPPSMLTLFAALLSERRIIITSRKISRLSSLAVASNLFLFPMSWQHIFIPVLPLPLQDYLSAPMPYLIGVPLPVWSAIPSETLGQVVIVHADTDTVTSPFPEDLESLPPDVVHLLRKNLTGERVLGDGLARAFLRALAQLMGHYQDAVRQDGAGAIFEEQLFVQFAHPGHRDFISGKLLKLQIFQQFVDERLEMIKNGSCESDEFELESLAWRSSRAGGKNGLRVLGGRNWAPGGNTHNGKGIRKAGKAVMGAVKREGESILESVKQNSALKSAVRSIKESGKSVKQKGHEFRSKFHQSGQGSSRGGSEAYRRHGQVTSVLHPPTRGNLGGGEQETGMGNGRGLRESASYRDFLTSSDNNLVASMSTGKMEELGGANGGEGKVGGGIGGEGVDRRRLQPRLSKSEENLIDLDTPTALGGLWGGGEGEEEEDPFDPLGEEEEQLGGGQHTLENPLYQLLTDNNNLFPTEDKTDAELLSEYGLTSYFDQMNFGGSCGGNGGGVEQKDPFSPPPVGLNVLPRPQGNGTAGKVKSPGTPGILGNSSGFGASWAKFD